MKAIGMTAKKKIGVEEEITMMTLAILKTVLKYEANDLGIISSTVETSLLNRFIIRPIGFGPSEIR